MKLLEFIAKLQTIAEQMGSHHELDDELSFFMEKDGELIDLEILDVVPLSTCGCGCWYGADIELKEKTNES